MKWLTFEIQRSAGFRFNLIDLGLIAFLLAIAWGLHGALPNLNIYWVPLYLGSSFFLFCNVFRIGNRLEPFWYLPFFLVSVYCLNLQDLERFWLLVAWLLEPIKWALILLNFRRPGYHGICHQWVNSSH